MNPLHPKVAERAGHRCEYCRAPEWVQNTWYEVEHILPKSKGGTDDPIGLALACRSCNSHKSNRRTGRADDGTIVTLYNPRCDLWNEHFQLDLLSGLLTGRTPIGQATIIALNMNSTHQVAARLFWIQNNLLPG